MTAESDNVETLKQAYAHWHGKKAGAQEFLEALLDDNIQLTSLADGAPGLEFTGKRSGKEQFLTYIASLTTAWEMNSYIVDDYIAQGDRVVAIGTTSWRNRQTNLDVTTPKVDIWRFKNGKAVELSEFYDTAKMIAATRRI